MEGKVWHGASSNALQPTCPPPSIPSSSLAEGCSSLLLNSHAIQLICSSAGGEVNRKCFKTNRNNLSLPMWNMPSQVLSVLKLYLALGSCLCSWEDPLMALQLKGKHTSCLLPSADPQFLFQLLELQLPSGEAVLAQDQGSTKVSFGVQQQRGILTEWCVPMETNPWASHCCLCRVGDGGRERLCWLCH